MTWNAKHRIRHENLDGGIDAKTKYNTSYDGFLQNS